MARVDLELELVGRLESREGSKLAGCIFPQPEALLPRLHPHPPEDVADAAVGLRSVGTPSRGEESDDLFQVAVTTKASRRPFRCVTSHLHSATLEATSGVHNPALLHGPGGRSGSAPAGGNAAMLLEQARQGGAAR